MVSFGVPKKTQKYSKNGWEGEKSGRPGGMSKPLGRIIGGFWDGFGDGSKRTEHPRKKGGPARRPRWGGGSLRAFRRAASSGWWVVGFLVVGLLGCCVAVLLSRINWLVGCWVVGCWAVGLLRCCLVVMLSCCIVVLTCRFLAVLL